MKRTLAILFCIATLALAGIISGGLVMLQIATPTNPASGSNKLYFKSDNKLYSLTSAGTETEIGAGGGSSVDCDQSDPTQICIVEDFIAGYNNSGIIGTHGWRIETAGSGGFIWLGSPPSNHSGVLLLYPNTTIGGAAVLSLKNNYSGNQIPNADLTGKDWTVSYIARLALSTSGARARLGMSGANTVAGDGTEAHIWLRYDEDAAYADNTKNTTGSWVAQWCGSQNNCGDTGGATVTMNVGQDLSWHRFTIKHEATGNKLTFTIDGTSKTICASGCDSNTQLVATAGNAVGPAAIIGTSNTTDKNLYVDWAKFKMTGLNR
jgi:hypothetical protein